MNDYVVLYEKTARDIAEKLNMLNRVFTGDDDIEVDVIEVNYMGQVFGKFMFILTEKNWVFYLNNNFDKGA